MKTLLLTLLAVWTATSSPTESITQLENFTVYLETSYKDWSISEEWDSASKSYNLIKKDLKSYKFNDEQLQEIGKYQGRCTVVFSKHYMDKAEETAKKAITKIGGFFDGVGEGLKK